MKFIISTMIKDEQLYLDEWLKYHLHLGFNEIHLYEDIDSTSHLCIVDKYKNVYLHKISDMNIDSREKILAKLNTYTVQNFASEGDWIAAIDADEFIRVSIPLKLIPEYFTIGINMNWQVLTADGHILRPLGNVQDNYHKVLNGNHPYLSNVTKVMAPYKKDLKWTGPHSINQETWSGTYLIWIDHYFTKSFEEYCTRVFKRKDVYRREFRKLDLFFEINDDICLDDVKDFLNKNYPNWDNLVNY